MRNVAHRGAFAAVLGAVLLGTSISSIAVGWALRDEARPHRLTAWTARPPIAVDPEMPVPAIVAPVGPRAPAPEPGDAAPPIEPGKVAYLGPRTGQRVAITFDDGPSPTLTPRVLDVLRAHGVHATFFLLGTQVEKYPAMAQAIAVDGHDVANHSYSHRSFRSMFPSHIMGELERTDRAIEAATGHHPRFVRPPYGRFPDSTIALVAERGGDLVLWSVDAGDWADAQPQAIADAVVRAAYPGAIILLHDREPATVRALPMILEGLERRGLEPVRISELLQRPAYLEPSASPPGPVASGENALAAVHRPVDSRVP
jgi:peptidoglycan/xylan/chitin deacetylase (PgdA/CDA1 family)